jgi:HK97 family phage portal protein
VSLLSRTAPGLVRATNRLPVPIVSRRSGQVSLLPATGGNRATQLQAMERIGIVLAIVDSLAGGVSTVNWKLYRTSKRGGEDDRTEVTTHPALVVLNKPNKFMTRQELFEVGQQHQELVGESWWVLGYDERVNMPLEIWPVRPDRMAPREDPLDYLTGYTYTTPDGALVGLDAKEVVFVRRPNPFDAYRGLGTLQSVLMHADSERYTAEWNRNFFLNGAIPGGIIEIDKRLSDAEYDEMSTRWREQHQGARNAHRAALLENGAKWKDVRYSQKDMMLTELLVLSDEKIRQAWAFPKPMLGSVDDVNRANAEAATYVFAKWHLVRRLERWKAALNNDFLPLFPASDGLEFDYVSPVPEDETAENAERDSKVAAVVALVQAGFDPVAALAWLDLPALPYTRPAPATPASTPRDGGTGAGLGQDASARIGAWLVSAPAGELGTRLGLLAAVADRELDAIGW